jgi:type IV secretion system protein VirD4
MQTKTLIRTAGAGLVTAAAGWLLAGHPGHHLTGAGLILAGLTLAGLPVWCQTRVTGSARLIGRRDRHSRRHAGTASRLVFRCRRRQSRRER